MSAAPRPPRLPRALLRRAVPDEARDEVDGDLHELWAARRAATGAFAAALWYCLETLSFAMRFTLDRLARGLRSAAAGDARPSVLDLKLGARMLAKSPGLALVGGLGMAVAVALGTAAQAVIDTYFYPVVPLHEGERVVAVGKFDARRGWEDERLLHDFLVWRRELRSVVDLGAFRTIRRNLVPETGQGEPITLAEMTASGFRAARVPPLLGRPLVEADEAPGAPEVVVIGHDAWQTRFAGDPKIVGREIRIGRTLHTIVGVMPDGFGFPISHRYWVPLRIDPASRIEPGSGPSLEVFGRIAPGATKQSAQAELTVLNRRLAAEGPKNGPEMEARIVPYTDIFVNGEAEGEMYTVLRFLVTLFLVVVSMNVAVLVYARTVMRTGEIAVRTALGASRGRIVSQLFVEAFVLSGLAALVGLGAVAIGLRMFDRALEGYFEGQVPFWMHSGLSAGTVLYALALATLAAVIIGVFPALRATGAQLRLAMGSLGSGAKARLGPTWTVLIVAQVAITVVMLPLALRKGSEMLQIATREAGFAPGEYLSTRFAVEREARVNADARSDSIAADSARLIMNALLAQLASEPGVLGTTITSSDPWGGASDPVEVDDPETPAQRVGIISVDTSYFGLFGARMIAGRNFTAADAALRNEDRPVVVNRSFVAEVLGGDEPIGRRVRYASDGDEPFPWHTIVGVVEDFPRAIRKPGGGSARSARMFHVAAPGEMTSALLTIRLSGQAPEEFAPALRRIATSVDPMLQLSQTSALDAMYAAYTRSGAQLALVVALVAGSVLLLSAAGIHALMSFTVSQRRREIGIRTALGAPAPRILTSVLARAMRQLALGVGVGLATAVVLDRVSGGGVMDGSGLLLVPGTAAFMLLVGMAAAAGPARRGLRVQPTEALQAE